jgi:hypothetical protein
LIALAGRKHIRPSLKTSDFTVAKKAYRKVLGEIEDYFEGLEARLAGLGRVDRALATGDLEGMRRADIERLVRDWWQHREQGLEDDEGVLPLTPAEVDELREHFSDEAVSRIVDRLLVEAGVSSAPLTVGRIQSAVLYPKIERSGESYRLLLELVERGLRIEEQRALDRAAGRRTATYDPLFNPLGDRSGPNGLRGPRNVEDLISAFRAEREAQHGIESTSRKYDLLFRALREVWGPDLPVRHIDRSRVIQIKQLIEALPPNSMKRFPKLSLREAANHARSEHLAVLASNTVNTYMQNLIALLRWAEGQDWGVKIYLRDLVPGRRAQVKRRGYEPAELTRLFAALAEFKDSEPAKFWVPSLALYSGARLGSYANYTRLTFDPWMAYTTSIFRYSAQTRAYVSTRRA